MQSESSSVLIYQDCFHRNVGRRFCQTPEAATSANHSPLVEWKFELLRSASLRAIAGSEAQRAQTVTVAAAIAGELPDYLKSWFESWCSRRTIAHGVLVLILSRYPGFRPAAWPDLRFLQTQSAHAARRFIIYQATDQPVADDHDFFLPQPVPGPGVFNNANR